MAKKADAKNKSTNCGYQDCFGQDSTGADYAKNASQNKSSNKTSNKASNKSSGTDSYGNE